MEGIITNGIRDGLWTYWNYKGQKIGEGSWIDNDKDGKWKWWYPNGNLSFWASQIHSLFNF